jgi:tRNA(Ile)-lysidine synthase
VYRKDRNVVRPLLFAERSDIEEYARTERIAFRTDSSNLTDHYTRNFIRHEIIPSLRANINPTLVQTLQRTSDLFRELDAYLRHNARRTLEVITTRKTAEDLHISIPGLRSCPVLLQQYVVLFAIEDFTGQRPEYELVDRILGLTEGLTGSWVPLGDDHAAFRDRDTLAIRQVNVEPEYRIIVQQNRTYEFSRFRFASEVLPSLPANRQETGSAEYVDADSVSQGDLVLRTWTDGDAFIPLGMKAMKKVSDFFVDAKVPVYEKRRYPILETQDGRIVWVCGQRIDDRFKITEDTRRVIRLEFTLLENGERVPLHQG